MGTNAMSENTMTTAVETTPVVESQDNGASMLAMLQTAVSSGNADGLPPALKALLLAGIQAQQAPPPAAIGKDVVAVYDATFPVSDDRVLLAIAIKPAGQESVRAKCWITDAEALAILDNADAVRAVIGRAVADRKNEKPRSYETREKPESKRETTPAGKKQAAQQKAKAKSPKVDPKQVAALVKAGLSGAGLASAIAALNG